MEQQAQIRKYRKTEVASFRSTKEKYGGLSNMAGGYPLRVEGIFIHSSEALYQACRFPHRPEVQQLIIDQRSPMTAKMVSKPYREDSRPDWDRIRVRVMRWSLRVKLAMHWPNFGGLLLSTGELPIVEDSRRDAFWGAIPQDDGTLIGMNVLGRLLMELREELRGEEKEALRVVSPPPINEFLLLGKPIGRIGFLRGAHPDAIDPDTVANPNTLWASTIDIPEAEPDEAVVSDLQVEPSGAQQREVHPMKYPKRLIEVDLPIKRISAHARREKSIRHGHLSTLHIWWARRPLAACRAVICASLWPDPADPHCPQSFRDVAIKQMRVFAQATQSDKALAEICDNGSWQRYMRLAHGADVDVHSLKGQQKLRAYLLDFIADFAAWEASTNHWFLETARALTQIAHASLGGEKGTRPLVVDPFAGGGSIPLEALRVGADAFASDLNPVPVLLNKVILEYIPKYGHGLADEVRKWGEWIKREAMNELADFYPKDHDSATPIAYFWARTIKCEGPGCGAEVPLIRSLWLAKKADRSVALQLVPRPRAKRVDFYIIVKQRGGWVRQDDPKAKIGDPKFDGTVKRGSVTCPCCGYTTPATQMRKQLVARRGGSRDARLICVATKRDDVSGRIYRLPQEQDSLVVEKAQRMLAQQQAATIDPLGKVPYEPTPEGKGKGAGRAFSQRNYGMETFADAYTERQLLTLTTLARIVRESRGGKMPETVRILCGFALGRVNDLSMSLCRWLTSLEAIAAANGGQNRMPVVLDFVEANPFGGSGGDWLGQIDWIARVVEHIEASSLVPGTAARSAAQEPTLPDDAADAFITDPPYYDAFPYSDLSDFFFIWLKRAVGKDMLDYDGELVPKDDEVVVYDVAHGGTTIKDRAFFQREMTRAFSRWRDVTKPNGIGIVVFANKTTGGWESLIQSIIDAGWTATGSWPIDTERPNRQRAIDSAALGSSVHVVCRPRESPDGSLRANEVGDWRDVLIELPRRIHEWMPRLAEEGVVGADAIFACLGPALEIFSRYSRVEKASGEQVMLNEFLTHVWGAVAQEALAQIFKEADASGFEEDARLTAMWLWTLNAGANAENPSVNGSDGEEEIGDDEEEADKPSMKVKSGYMLEFDAARKIAQGLGAHLEQLEAVIEVKGDKARLLSVAERTRRLFGKDEAEAPQVKRKKKDKQMKLWSPEDLGEVEGEAGGWGDKSVPKLGDTALDRVHQSMILFAAGRGEAVRRFLVEDGAGKDQRFWKLANALSALYPQGTDEKRWVDGVLARKKGLGL